MNLLSIFSVISTNSYDTDSAVAGDDFEPLSKTVTFHGSDYIQTCDVTIRNDNVMEGAETFTISLSGSDNITPESRLVKVTIRDDDGKGCLLIHAK